MFQYASSENCMMELRFAAIRLKKPIIFVYVGKNVDADSEEVRIVSFIQII